MSDDIKQLIEKSRYIKMSEATKEAQRQSFAYGNANIENGRVTKEMVRAAAARTNEQ